ncbi:L-threonylcarbamoyladenylate synthase, partial [Acinetobacter baumannii]|uniref:L-threonylcarbamoyladenylate synthase n=1 Tax=Acinetobacter baumannii TaxID=470 RepID=UPI000A3F21E0
DHPLALALIRSARLPIAAPSANLSGRPSPTTAQHVLEDLDGRIAGVLDGGPTGIGVESTVVDSTGDVPL